MNDVGPVPGASLKSIIIGGKTGFSHNFFESKTCTNLMAVERPAADEVFGPLHQWQWPLNCFQKGLRVRPKQVTAAGRAWQVILMSVFFEEAAIIICKQYLRII